MTRARVKYSCDFETTTDVNDCRVWAWIAMEIGDVENYRISKDIDSFMKWCEMVKADLYFHNLKFDGEFIVNWLLHNGFKHSNSEEPNTFNTVISSMGQWYKIDIVYGRNNDRPLKTSIFDSLKKLPFPVRRIAQAFKLPIMKGEIDYHKPRPIGYTPDKNEIEYIKNDAEIIARALEIQFSQGLTKMTTGSDSLAGFKKMISTKLFKKKFPVLSLELDNEVRQAYRGGFTWLNERFGNQALGNGIVYDVNSLYPSQMRYRELPYGVPIFFDGEYKHDPDYPLYIQKITCRFELKEGYIPTIQVKKNISFRQNEYLKSSNGEDVELCLTNVDLELFLEHYDVSEDIQYHGGWKFMSATGLFNDFIDYWMSVKVSSTGAIKELAKLMLNSLYGKFASNPDVTGRSPYLKDDGSTGYSMNDPEFKEPVYTPMGAFITAWARYTTITTAQKCFDRIIYCDTDSIHLVGTDVPEAIADQIDDNELGKWAFEGTFVSGKYLRQKTYIHYMKLKEPTLIRKRNRLIETTHQLVVKCAGMPDAVKKVVTFDSFEIGFSSNKKKRPVHAKGGVVLIDGKFEIR